MNANTRSAIVAVMATDPSITEEQRAAALAALDGAAPDGAPLRPLVKARDVERLLGVKRTTVFNLRKSGVLVAVRAPGASRTAGYTRDSVEAYLKGVAS